MNVKIIRVLNTNAVVSVDSQGMELIMTGPGIGFKKRKGENIDQSLVDKTYHLENKEESKRLQEVVKEISEEYLGIVDRVVKEAKKEKLEIRDSLYVTLTDHINSAVARYREGIALKNMMKIDIRKFYPKEYQVGMHAIEWIKEQTGEDLGDDEAAFIAMHIVSAELNAQNIMVDADAQGNASRTMGVYEPNEKGLAGILLEQQSVEETIRHTRYENVDIIPANMWLMQANAQLLYSMDNQIDRIEKMLNSEDINKKYDYTICDCGLLLDVTVINVVKASDLLIIPVKAGGYGIEAIENMIEQAKGIHEGQQIKILMTMKTGNQTNKDTAKWLRDTYKDKMFQTEIRRSVVAEKAETAFRPLSEMSKSSNAAKDYNNVIREIMTDEEWNAAQAYIESKRRNKKTGRFQKVD